MLRIARTRLAVNNQLITTSSNFIPRPKTDPATSTAKTNINTTIPMRDSVEIWLHNWWWASWLAFQEAVQAGLWWVAGGKTCMQPSIDKHSSSLTGKFAKILHSRRPTAKISISTLIESDAHATRIHTRYQWTSCRPCDAPKAFDLR